MGFKCGIVGLPNVGKSTLFNALTSSKIEAQNYPFCTIEPNLGMVTVPDARLDAIASIAQSQKVIHTFMEFVDIAGLVEGASKGEGLGNRFLSHIRSVDAIAHVVRCFEDDNITHVAGRVNPLDDIATIETELALADCETLEKALQKNQKLCKSGDKEALKEKPLLEALLQQLSVHAHLGALKDQEAFGPILTRIQLLTAKPCFYIANVSEEDITLEAKEQTTGEDSTHPNTPNPYVNAVMQHALSKGAEVVCVSAKIESDMVGMDAQEKEDFLKEMGLGESGLSRIIRQGYSLLGLATFFTCGPKEARAWTIPSLSTAPQAAGAIHTDFEKHFIRAEVIASCDYIAVKGEQAAKAQGLWRLEGKDYLVKDGDILAIRHSA